MARTTRTSSRVTPHNGGNLNTATILDVARHAQVSTATVSRVLANHPYVSEKTRRKVLHALRSLGYTPNRLARGLRSGLTHTVGMLIREASNTKFGLIVAAAQDLALGHGYQVLVSSSSMDPDRERRLVESLVELRVDGLIIYAADEERSDLDVLHERGIPTVLIESGLERYPFDRVSSDNVAGARAATDHLLHLGHRRIGLILKNTPIRPTYDRLRGYTEALAARGIPVDESLIVRLGSDPRGMVSAVRALLSTADPPTAIFATTSGLTASLLEALQTLKVAVPGHVSVIGYDDTEFSRLTVPALTVVHRDIPALGRTAMELLLKRLSGELTDGPQSVTLPASLLVRASCTPLHRA